MLAEVTETTIDKIVDIDLEPWVILSFADKSHFGIHPELNPCIIMRGEFIEVSKSKCYEFWQNLVLYFCIKMLISKVGRSFGKSRMQTSWSWSE
jgi:hypothetical protein